MKIVLLVLIVLNVLIIVSLISHIINYLKIKNAIEVTSKLECKTNLYSDEYFKYFPDEKGKLESNLEKYNKFVDKVNSIPRAPATVSKTGNTIRIRKNNKENIEHETLHSDIKVCIYKYELNQKSYYLKIEKSDDLFSDKDFGAKQKNLQLIEKNGENKLVNKEEISKNIKSSILGFIFITACIALIIGVVG